MPYIPLPLIAQLLTSTAAPVTTFECNYPTYSDKKGVHAAKSPMRLSFIVDPATEKAYLTGELGSSEVQMISNTDGLTFLEITPSGNVMTTTITAGGESVHSRNTILFKNELVASQHYGSCRKK